MAVGIQMPRVQQEEEPTSTKIAKAISGFAQSAMDRKFKEQQLERQSKLDEQSSIRYENEQQAKGDQQIIENAQRARALDIQEKAAGKRAEADPFKSAIMEERLRKMQEDRDKAAFAKTPEGRLQGLASTDKQRLDNAKLGLTSTQGMADALLRKGENTFSLFGDNNFTQQRTLFEESLGRMQSGGAITAEEADRFKAMAPTWKDSPEIQRKKLEQLNAEMSNRIATLGFKPEELGIQQTNIAALQPPGSGGGLIRPDSLIIPQANASAGQMAPVAPPPPKSGEVINGYRFRGGDPANQKNWEKAK